MYFPDYQKLKKDKFNRNKKQRTKKQEMNKFIYKQIEK